MFEQLYAQAIGELNQRLTELESTVEQQSQLINFLSSQILNLAMGGSALAALNENLSNRVTYLESGDEGLSGEPPTVPSEGYLDVASYVKSRLGHDDLRLASQFGRTCAQAARHRGLEPEKVTQPGAHWREVNAWPTSFLSEMWHLSFGGDRR